MIGLEFICKLNNIEFKKIAEKLGIRPQTINSWLRNIRKIPEKRLEQLEVIFPHIEKKYFQKELIINKKVINKYLSKLLNDLTNKL